MRAITVAMPNAELIRRGLKQYEVRAWPVNFRGLLAIHAGTSPFKPGQVSGEFRAQLLQDEVDTYGLRYGQVLCVVDLVDCIEVETALGNPREYFSQTRYKAERIYDDWSTGRFAWKLENVRSLDREVKLPGRGDVWDWPDGDDVLKEIW